MSFFVDNEEATLLRNRNNVAADENWPPVRLRLPWLANAGWGVRVLYKFCTITVSDVFTADKSLLEFHRRRSSQVKLQE